MVARIIGVVAIALMACKEDAASPSWLRVELVPVADDVQNAQVLVTSEGGQPFPLCVNITGEAGVSAASFVLERAAEADPTAPVSVEVTPFAEVSGSLDAGKDFACPASLPPALGPARRLALTFCEAESRIVQFQLDADCPCSPGMPGGGAGGAGGAGGGAAEGCCEEGLVCGAGVSTTGSPCAADQCCRDSIPDACGLLLAPQ